MRRRVLWLIVIACGLGLAGLAIAGPPWTVWGAKGEPGPLSPVIAAAGKANGPPPIPRYRPPDDGLGAPAPARLDRPRTRHDSAVTQAKHEAAPASNNSAAVLVEARAPARATEGEPFPVTITVRNVGPCIAGPVIVTLPLPAGTKLVDTFPPAEAKGGALWDLPHLLPGAERTFRATVKPGLGESVALRPEVSFSQAAGPTTRIIRPPLGLVIDAPEQVTVGDGLAFRMRVTNNTPSTARRVALSCEVPALLACSLGQNVVAELPSDLSPGQSHAVELPVLARSVGRGVLTVKAQADGGLTARGSAVVLIVEPAVRVEITGPRRFKLGDEADFTIAVANPGQCAVGQARAVLTLPGGVEFVSAGQGGAFHAGARAVAWGLDGVPPRGERKLTARLRGVKGGDWALGVVAQAGASRPARHTRAVLVEFRPKLTAELTRLDAAVRVGAETTLELRLFNPGPGAVEQIQARATLPEHLLPVQAGGPAPWRVEGQSVSFQAAQLPAGRDVTFTVRVRGVAAGPAQVQSSVQAAGLAPLTQEAAIEVRP